MTAKEVRLILAKNEALDDYRSWARIEGLLSKSERRAKEDALRRLDNADRALARYRKRMNEK